jgi:hypothetical protein
MFRNKHRAPILRYTRTNSGDYNEAVPPTPAIRTVPDWYKDAKPTGDLSIPQYTYAGKLNNYPPDPDPLTQVGATMKRCMPFFDSLSLGYMIVATDDMYFDGETGLFSEDPVQVQQHTHSPYEFEGYPFPDGYHANVFKWNGMYKLTPPDGYSVLVMHPMHRHDLPFHTLSAVVDMDKHPLDVNYPMIMRKGFTGKIPAGTPLVQLLPFKRESWSRGEDTPQEFVGSAVMNEFFEFNERGEPRTGVYKRKARSKKDFN